MEPVPSACSVPLLPRTPLPRPLRQLLGEADGGDVARGPPFPCGQADVKSNTGELSRASTRVAGQGGEVQGRRAAKTNNAGFPANQRRRAASDCV